MYSWVKVLKHTELYLAGVFCCMFILIFLFSPFLSFLYFQLFTKSIKHVSVFATAKEEFTILYLKFYKNRSCLGISL